jgi:hypothetical protein
MKFVPASGAATRMFKALLSFYGRPGPILEAEVRADAEKGDKDSSTLLDFIDHLESFAFYEQLTTVMKRAGLVPRKQLEKGEFSEILEYTLTSRGLDLASLPKGLIPFHLYPDQVRTPVEEHLKEAALYASDRDGRALIHFTVSPEHMSGFREHVDESLSRYRGPGNHFQVTYSIQKPSTDTIGHGQRPLS